jgi:hypothetical protein
VLLPQSLPIISELTVSHAMHEMQQGTAQDTVRSTQIRSTRVGLNGTFLGQRTTVNAGWDAVFSRTHNEIGGLFQNVETPSFGIPAFGFYIDPEFNLGGGLSVRPGLRLQLYNVRHKPYLEPRLRVVWDRRIHHLSGAVGLYHQQVIGLNDRRDAASVFTAWTGTPRYDEDLQGRLNEDILRGRIGTAWHGLLGYRSDPTPWLEFSVEGFYKALTNLFISEWTALPQLSTRLLQATGRSYGIEARVELRRGPVYAYVTYGLSNTEYAAEGRAIEVWYGMEELRYRPAHDRRHQINTVLSSTWHGFELNLRWAFGSGLPYTRPLAFDGFALVDDVRPAEDLEHSRRVIYERPFDSLLPTYHRLDVSLQYTWHLRRVELTLQGSIINAYDRRNIFYVDVFTLERQDQLPFIPSLGIKIEVD